MEIGARKHSRWNGQEPTLRQIFLVWAIFLVQACQTLSPRPEIQLPAKLNSIFDQCENGDGSLALVLTKGGETTALNFDWVANGHSWDIESFSPIGQTTLALKYISTANVIQVSGPFTSHLPKLAVDSDGFMEVDGHFIPILARELACFLDGKISSAWRSSLHSYERNGARETMLFVEPRRQMDVDYVEADDPKDHSLCIGLSWKRLWGLMRSAIQICSSVGPPQVGNLEGLDGYEIRWTKAAD